jgi:cell division protein FtsN
MEFPFLKKGMPENTVNRQADGPRRYTFEISLSGLIALSVAGLLGLVWVFILGVLLGRGYHPESAVPEIAQIMPAPEEKKAEPKPQALKAEDLSYMDELTKKPGETPGAPAAKPAEPPAVKTTEVVPAKPATPAEAAPAPSPEPAKPAETAAPATPAAPPAQTAAKPAPPAATGKVLFTYQASAFRKEAQAKELKSKIDGLGIDARIETGLVSGETWYRVLVSDRGGENDMEPLRASLKERLQSAGVKELIYRTKKPI